MIYCIVTADSKELLSGELDRFLLSIKDQDFLVILVLRDVSDEVAAHYDDFPKVEKVIRSGRAGISVVRNLGLIYLSSVQLSDGDFVAFPDDDCMYPKGFDIKLFNIIESTRADLVVGSYGEGQFEDTQILPLTKRTAMLGASSVTIFVRWDLLCRVGGFNEHLGVGSLNFSYGEDNDFSYRLVRSAIFPVYSPGLRVWHLEARETVGRNSKGYLSVSRINLDVFQLFCVFLPGIAKGVVRDVLNLDLGLSEIVKIAAALNRKGILLAFEGKAYAAELLKDRA